MRSPQAFCQRQGHIVSTLLNPKALLPKQGHTASALQLDGSAFGRSRSTNFCPKAFCWMAVVYSQCSTLTAKMLGPEAIFIPSHKGQEDKEWGGTKHSKLEAGSRGSKT